MWGTNAGLYLGGFCISFFHHFNEAIRLFYCLDRKTKIVQLQTIKMQKSGRERFRSFKARFRRIGKGLDNRIGNAPMIIRACCVLHNFLNEESDHINQIWLENLQEFDRNQENPSQNVVLGDNEASAETIRQSLCSYFGK